jgi:hypothetical protein
VLSQLQSLQDIRLRTAVDTLYNDQLPDVDPEAVQLAAVTSSSQLTLLDLTCRRVPAGAVQHMFPAGRQQLQTLSIKYTAGWELAPGVGWEVEPGDISRIVACCPNLQCLARLACTGEFVGVGCISTSELQQLRQLTALSTLSIGKPHWDTAAAAVLAGLTGGCMALAFTRAAAAAVSFCADAATAAELRVATVLQLEQLPTAQVPLVCSLSCLQDRMFP